MRLTRLDAAMLPGIASSGRWDEVMDRQIFPIMVAPHHLRTEAPRRVYGDT
jgi:hypothetical protein